jgi:hypothetical protein
VHDEVVVNVPVNYAIRPRDRPTVGYVWKKGPFCQKVGFINRKPGRQNIYKRDRVRRRVYLRPEFRLVERDDPEAYQFTATKCSACKPPGEVVDASAIVEGGIRELMEGWKRALDKLIEEERGRS